MYAFDFAFDKKDMHRFVKGMLTWFLHSKERYEYVYAFTL